MSALLLTINNDTNALIWKGKIVWAFWIFSNSKIVFVGHGWGKLKNKVMCFLDFCPNEMKNIWQKPRGITEHTENFSQSLFNEKFVQLLFELVQHEWSFLWRQRSLLVWRSYDSRGNERWKFMVFHEMKRIFHDNEEWANCEA